LIEKTTQVPVLTSSISAGDMISSSDVEWVDIALRHMVNDTVIDADKLIGKTPVRMVEQGVPVRARDVVFPQLVARGDEVLLQFNQGGLQLTVRGKAMQNGAEGEFIRVMNLSSNQSLRGEVTGSKVVSVQ
jgi:flagella basal body P-ring formation protein FlgA